MVSQDHGYKRQACGVFQLTMRHCTHMAGHPGAPEALWSFADGGEVRVGRRSLAHQVVSPGWRSVSS